MQHADQIRKSKSDNGLAFYALESIGLLVTAALIYACLHQGLFFPSTWQWISIWFPAVLLVLWLITTNRASNSAELMYNHIPIVFIPLFIALIYVWHLQFGNPVSVNGTRDSLMQFFIISVFAAGCYILGQSIGGKKWLSAGFQLTGWLMTLSGLLAVCGLLVLPNAVMRTDDPLLSAYGARLAGLVEYPNAYGVLVGMFFLERLASAASACTSSPTGELRKVAGTALGLFPAATALLISESRGAWLALLLSALALLLLQRQGRRLPLLCASAPPLLCAALAHQALAGAALAPAPLPGLMLLAGGEIAALALALLLHALLARGHSVAAACMALAALTGAAGLVYHTAISRITSGATWFAREAMWRDAVLYGLRSPWLGHGGDAWKHAVYTVQSTPYIGTEVHSGYLELFLDTGVMGLMLMLLLFAYILRLLLRHSRDSIPVCLIVMLHGAVDFDFSYPLFWMLLVLIAAWKLPVQRL
ncbi:O-antigen ligase family protein [Paenibacillus urinalis]|uniref:O-antigen ligase family protein n=1 Tax=Paenibacillus urinalis TaxID=521520 RepID=A0AAX3MXE2_9BACL|nr:O-antigen ligase family protein [Paenibacillus urinalis]WDH82018.1 O-antigen ligase family protein [Paenibacillus urinalis]